MTRPHRPVRQAPWALLGAAWLAAALPAAAQTFKDPGLEALYATDRTDELRRVAAQRVAAQADDAQAVLALALTALDGDDADARRHAIARAEACTGRQARAAPCQYALGVVLGIQAMTEGLFKAARSAGTVRDALAAAHQLEPAWWPARSALMEFYLMAPGMMGGSSSKAAELGRSAPSPEQARVIEARIAMNDRRFDAALHTLMALPAALEPSLAADVRGWGTQAALGLVNEGRAALAQPWFERLMRERPGRSDGAYGLARVRAEAGDHATAVRLYEQAQGLKGAQAWPIGYRLGQSLQQLGRLDDARAAYRRFLATGKGPKRALEDAQQRLEQLGG
jgi:tetratricopeptide (TPR) repeat protein